jgi:DeoR/GlpR family transcriptional regulator of sugar metabolism
VDIKGATGADPVLAAERKRHIAEYVATRGRARIGELAELFAVTEQTIRKDLRTLDQLGVLKRTHGGVLALERARRDPVARSAANPDAKERIGRACLRLLADGDAAFFDNGSTVRGLVQALASAQRSSPSRLLNLTVLTNAPDVAVGVAGLPMVQHVLLGGQLELHSGAIVGPLAIQNLQRFMVDVAFIGVSGFSESGLSVATVADAEVKASIIERARRVVVPCDVTKAGTTDFARICALDAVNTVVVDRAAPKVERLCEAHGITLIVAA